MFMKYPSGQEMQCSSPSIIAEPWLLFRLKVGGGGLGFRGLGFFVGFRGFLHGHTASQGFQGVDEAHITSPNPEP